MDSMAFVEWAWSLSDDGKRALAAHVVAIRAGTDDRFLGEARSAADAALANNKVDVYRADVAAAPSAALDLSESELEAWNTAYGNALRETYEDMLRALGAAAVLGRGHHHVLVAPMLSEFPGLSFS
jgi:hypothetical protein